MIGSSCIGASVFGGVCNNSGGALIHRGPAYTQLTLFARIDEARQGELVNHLGVRLGDDPETILAPARPGEFARRGHRARSEPRGFGPRIYSPRARHRRRHAGAVQRRPAAAVRGLGQCGQGDDLCRPARHVSRREARRATFYIGTNDPAELTTIRRHILSRFSDSAGAGRISSPGRLRHRGEIRQGHVSRDPLSRNPLDADVVRDQGPVRRHRLAHTPPAARHQRQARAVWKRALSAPSPETHDGIPRTDTNII